MEENNNKEDRKILKDKSNKGELFLLNNQTILFILFFGALFYKLKPVYCTIHNRIKKKEDTFFF